MGNAETFFTELLDEADVAVNGSRPWDIKVHDERLYPNVLAKRNLGLGEAYMAGWWDCERVDEFIHRVLHSGAADKVRGGIKLLLGMLPAFLCNQQSIKRARQVAERHYDLGNDLFGAFLDPYRQYSCAYFKDTDELDAAQVNKLRLICEKLELGPGQRLLDIGSGWGGLAKFAAEEYGCDVVGVNISKEQIAFSREFCKGLPVEIRDMDYRELDEPFDKIVSVGMFEHVGCRNHREFMRVAARCLKPGGSLLLHTIGSNTTGPGCDPWITRYIFPNGSLPSVRQVAKASEDVFVMEDMHNLGPHYDATLMCWLENFRNNWDDIRDRYGETFRRMWEYYLQSCAGAFRARDIQLWQFVFTPIGSPQPCCRAV